MDKGVKGVAVTTGPRTENVPPGPRPGRGTGTTPAFPETVVARFGIVWVDPRVSAGG